MSAATTGRHTRKPGNTHQGQERRRWRDRWRRRSTAVPAGPGSGHPHPEPPSDAQIEAMIAGLRPAAPLAAFSGESVAGLPDDTSALAAIREAAVPEPSKLLQRVRDGIRNLDEPEPLAFIRTGGADGSFGEYWALTGEPAFLGLAECGDQKVAEVRLGYLPDGRPLIAAGNRRALDAVLMVARDRLVYGSGTGSTPAAEPPATGEQAQPEVPAAEPETTDAPEPAPDGEDRDDPHAFLISRATGLLGRAAFLPEPEDQAAADEITSKTAVLTQALNLHRDVASGVVEPFWVFADLPAGEDSSRTAALERLSADIADAQEALIEAARRYRDDETAALVAGQAGGAQ